MHMVLQAAVIFYYQRIWYLIYCLIQGLSFLLYKYWLQYAKALDDAIKSLFSTNNPKNKK